MGCRILRQSDLNSAMSSLTMSTSLPSSSTNAQHAATLESSLSNVTIDATKATATTGPVTFYFAMLSQPSRAVRLLLQHCSIPCIERVVLVFKQENRTPEFLAMNPAGEVPVLKDGEFILAESHTILRYLCARFSQLVPSHFYPSGESLAAIQARARIDTYLDWHHCHLRQAVTPLVRATNWSSNFPGELRSIEQLTKITHQALQDLNDRFLVEQTQFNDASSTETNMNTAAGRGPFLLGNSQISIADLSAICEVNMLDFIGLDYSSTWPKIGAWAKRVQKETARGWTITHETFDKMVAEYAAKRVAAKE